jgi:hypothetical protein
MKNLILMGLILIFATSAEADYVQCCPKGNFSTGASKGELIAKCGAPLSRDRRTYYEGAGELTRTIIIDELTYDFNSSCRMTLIFENGKFIKATRF